MTVAERLALLVLTTAPDRRAPVAIDGPACSGKTMLADRVAEAVGRRRPAVRASIDDFHHPRAHRYRRGELSAQGCYRDTFDHEALRTQLLDPWGPGGSGAYRTKVFDAATDAPVDQAVTTAASNAVLIFDGVCAQRRELTDCWDLVILLRVSDDELLRRAVARDAHLFGSADDVVRRYRTRYLPAQRLYERRDRPFERAHVVVDNTYPSDPTVLGWPG